MLPTCHAACMMAAMHDKKRGIQTDLPASARSIEKRDVLQAELAHAMEQLKGQGVDLAEWRDALAAKDLEIQNLQVM